MTATATHVTPIKIWLNTLILVRPTTSTKNMSTYVDYKINLLDNDDDFYEANGIATDDIVAVGLVYQF